MLGWMLIFMFLSIVPIAALVAGGISLVSGMAAGTIFTTLLLLSALSRVLRNQA